MRILVGKFLHENDPKFTWFVAWVLPFTPVGACNYGSAGDVVSMLLTVVKTPREATAQNIFVAHVKQVAEEMHKNVHSVTVSSEDVVSAGVPGLSLSWLTDHTKREDNDGK